MKKLIITSIIALLVGFGTTVGAQEWPDEYLGLPGDNLNLYAVMKLFQESETLEGFEKSLNDKNNMINNLDLNGDNMVDYIMVEDYVDGDVHNIVLRVALNRNEYQDVAVFTVQRLRDGFVHIQLVGDEALYGRNYIVEPVYDEHYGVTPNPGYIGNTRRGRNITVIRTTALEVAAWPVIRFIYLPGYVAWRSSWNWGYYPVYWNPWRPYYWHYYYGYHSSWHPHYYKYYRPCNHLRYARYNDFYYRSIRVYSPRVTVKIKQGNYRNTYSRPDLRMKGEALYARRSAGHNTRTNVNSSVNNRNRSSVSQSVQTRPSRNAGSAVERRSATTVTNRNSRRTDIGKANNPSQRSKTTVTNKATTRPAARQATSTSKRSTTTINKSTEKSPTSVQKANTSRRSVRTINKKRETSPSVNKSTNISRRSTPAVTNNTIQKPSSRRTTVTSRRSSPITTGRTSVTSGRSSSSSSSKVARKSSSVRNVTPNKNTTRSARRTENTKANNNIRSSRR